MTQNKFTTQIEHLCFFFRKEYANRISKHLRGAEKELILEDIKAELAVKCEESNINYNYVIKLIDLPNISTTTHRIKKQLTQ